MSQVDASPTADIPTSKPGRGEWIFLIFTLAVCFCLNAISCRWYPTVWADEVSFAEPAINYAQHEGFVTRVWPFQTNNTFPALNCPLYGLTLAAWLSIMGTSLLAARSLNYVLVGFVALLMWRLSWRFRLLTRPVHRIALVLLVESGYGMCTTFRFCRPDMLGAVWLLLLATTFGLKPGRWRAGSQMVVAAAMVWTGLQVALVAAFFSFLIWVWFRKFSFKDVFMVAAGMMSGALLLILFFARQGVLPDFIVSVSSVTDLGSAAQHPGSLLSAAGNAIQRGFQNYLDDCSLMPILAGIILCLVIRRKNGARCFTRPVVLLILPVGLTPFLLNAAGHFSIFYSYLLFLPGCLLFLHLVESLGDPAAGSSRRSWPLLFGVAGLSLGVGLPLRLALTGLFCKMADERQVQSFLREQIQTNDVVFADCPVFFEVKQFANIVYVPDHGAAADNPHYMKRELSAAERKSISLLVIKPEKKGTITQWLGGEWETTGTPFGDRIQLGASAHWPVVGKKLLHYFSQRPNEREPLQILRRKPGHQPSKLAPNS